MSDDTVSDDITDDDRVASYDVQAQTAARGRPLGTWTDVVRAGASASWTTAAQVPGSQVCLRSRARDRAGNLDATAINLGKSTGTITANATSMGILNVSGGVVRAGSILLGNQANLSRATGILNVTGGTVNVATADITDGGGISTINVDGGTDF